MKNGEVQVKTRATIGVWVPIGIVGSALIVIVAIVGVLYSRTRRNSQPNYHRLTQVE